MRSLKSLFCVLLLASIASAQAEQSSSGAQNAATAFETKLAKPADNGPAVDEAKVTGGVFQSAYFKFRYQLPKDWKALDDAARVSANKLLQEQDASRPMPTRKRSTTAQPAASSPSQQVAPARNPIENYSLLIASPSGVASLNSVALPRVNIWAKRRIPPLDNIEDPAQFMTGMRYSRIIVKPQHLTFDGHDFVRASIETPNGEYRTQFVTIVGDYLIGFEFHSDSKQDDALGADSMKTVKFQ
jgi:hypothetical protein